MFVGFDFVGVLFLLCWIVVGLIVRFVEFWWGLIVVGLGSCGVDSLLG